MKLSAKKMHYILDIMINISHNAGRMLIKLFETKNFVYIHKPGKANIATNADFLVQQLIVEELKKHFPAIPIIAEETPQTKLTGSQFLFLVDPLDGTLNFIHGLPLFAVSIALLKEHKPILGVVYAPILNETFIAILNHGAFRNGQRLLCRKDIRKEDALGATGWPYDPDLLPWTYKTLMSMQQNIQEIRILGTAALEMCYVAAGIIDIYWEVNLQPWDLAAGSLVVSEAGGIVTDLNGKYFDPFSGCVLACRSKRLHQYAIKLLKTCSFSSASS
uniref:Inositol-1-monophosphatase n=1 Tax=Fervidobacterium pennivorans TaxID=93466 RepID=A0A7V4NFA9_FERPE